MGCEGAEGADCCGRGNGSRRGRHGGKEKLGGGAWTLFPPPCRLPFSSRLLPRAGERNSGTFWPVKGQLVVQGQRGSCLETEKLALCLKGRGEGRGRGSWLLHATPWPGPGALQLGWSPGQTLPVQLCVPRARKVSQDLHWSRSTDQYPSPARLGHFWKVLDSGAGR